MRTKRVPLVIVSVATPRMCPAKPIDILGTVQMSKMIFREMVAFTLLRTGPRASCPTIRSTRSSGPARWGWARVSSPSTPRCRSNPCRTCSRMARPTRANWCCRRPADTLKRFETEGVEAEIRTPAEVRKMLPVEMAKWANVAKVANIRTQ